MRSSCRDLEQWVPHYMWWSMSVMVLSIHKTSTARLCWFIIVVAAYSWCGMWLGHQTLKNWLCWPPVRGWTPLGHFNLIAHGKILSETDRLMLGVLCNYEHIVCSSIMETCCLHRVQSMQSLISNINVSPRTLALAGCSPLWRFLSTETHLLHASLVLRKAEHYVCFLAM